MDSSSLFVLAILGLLAYYIWISQGAKEIAHRAAKAHCNKVGVQFLDDSVVIRGLGVGRSPAGQLCFKRRYEFEFASTGERRYHGSVRLLGRSLAAIELEVYRVEDTEPDSTQPRLH